jgi:hypothetical protein
MKMQLAAEDVEQQMYEASVAITAKLAAVVSDISRLRQSLTSIEDSVDGLSTQVSSDERQCSAAASRLQQLHLIKGRVQATTRTFQVHLQTYAIFELISRVIEERSICCCCRQTFRSKMFFR